MRPTALTTTLLGLAGTSAVHLWQYVDGYSQAPNGWLFFVQAAAAAVLIGLVVVARDGIAAPAAAATLQVGSLVALGMAYTGSFLGFSESGLRLATVVTILSGAIGLVGAVGLLIGNLRDAEDGASARRLLVG